jgi:hypothetical protein
MHILMFLKQFQVKTDFAMEMDLFHISILSTGKNKRRNLIKMVNL